MIIEAFLIGTMIANGIGVHCMKKINKHMDTIIERCDTMIELQKDRVLQDHDRRVRDEVISYMVKESKQKNK